MKRLVLIAIALSSAFLAAPAARADEIDDALSMFSADDGLTAAEKLPALKAFIEAHKNDPGIAKLEPLRKELAAEAGEKAGADSSSAEAGGSSAAAAEAPSPADDGLPPVKLYTAEDADAAMTGHAAARPRAKRTFPLVGPTAEDGFFDNLTLRSGIAHARELIREIIGPLEGEDERNFEAKWNAVMDFPTTNITEWIRKASPIASEMVRIKNFINENVAEYVAVFDEANVARTFGAFAEAESLLADAEDIAEALMAAKERLAELQAKLEELGEMPDPEEEKTAARRRRKEAEETVKKAFGNKPSKGPEALEALCGIYVTGRYAMEGTPGVRAHVTDFTTADNYFFGGSYAPLLWRSDMMTIESLSYDKETELALLKFGYKHSLRITNQNFRVEYAFGKLDDDGGLILYLPIQDNLVRTVEECEKDAKVKYSAVSIRPEDGGMCLRGHFLTKNKNEGLDSWFVSRRYGKVGTLKDGKTVGYKNSSWRDAKTISQWKKDWVLYAKAYEYMCDRYFEGAGDVKVEELPLGDNMYRVMEKVEFCYRDPPYSEKDNDMRDNQRKGFAYMDTFCPYRKRAREEAQKAYGEFNAFSGDDATARESFTAAFEYGRNHLSYRYLGSIDGWYKRGHKGEWRKFKHYDNNNASFTGRWLPPKPVSRPWEPIRMAVHQINDIHPAKDTYQPKPVSLAVGFLHYTSVKRNKGDKYDRFEYFYGMGNHPTVALNNGALLVGIGDATVVGEKTPHHWICPETFVVATIGFRGAKGFHGTFDALTVPDDPRSAPANGGVRLVYHFRIKYMSKGEADALAKELGEKYFAEAAKDWGDNLKIPDEFSLADYSAIDPRPPEGSPAAEVAEAGEEKKPPTKEEIKAAEEAKKERIAFHNENIKFIDGTISRLKGELAKEKDASRRSAIQWQITCEESNRIHEQDCIRAEETGEFHASPTPFDAMCRMQVFESAMREVEGDRIMRREQERLRAFLKADSQFKLDADQKRRIEEQMEKIDRADPIKAAIAYRKLSENLRMTDVNSTVGRMATLEDEELKYSDLLIRAERVKLGCDIALALGGIAISGGVAAGELAPVMATKLKVLQYAYAMGCGYIEKGPAGILKGAACTYSDIVDIVWSGVDGYREGLKEKKPWMGALKGAGMSLVLNVGLPKIMGKVNWRKQITFRPGKGAAPKVNIDMPDVKAYKVEVEKARTDISNYIAAKNKINTMSEVDLASGKITDAQIQNMRMDVVKAAAKINANPTAKAILKYEQGYGKIGKDFNLELGRIHNAVKSEFYKDMKAKGFSAETINMIRNASSGKSVGMDADWGLDETKGTPITRDGKRVSVYDWMVEGQKSWNAKYLAVTGQRADLSFENVTTHVHPEAYRCMDILKAKGADSNMRNLLRRTSLADAQQIADVTRFKADDMLGKTDFPRLVYVREAARGSAKDLGGKFLPAIDAKMQPLVRLERIAGKHGSALSPAQARELNRLRAAHDYYSRVYKVFDDIGKGKLPPEVWDSKIYEITGGRGISQTLGDIGDIFKSLVF